ncbi:MAG: VirB4 family type IV secretion/conjugal transfer ATPase [Cyanobacteria bacterium SZAS LIN-2]|nr:VirB4 family type IV secretion/conjugal transfer ATPase [Cyanobacteria bacterium SZAS LIN-2]
MSLALLRKREASEPPVAGHIPYAAHVDRHVIRLRNGGYLQTLRLQGGSFESADDSTINDWHDRLNHLWRNLASSPVSVWTHIVRRRDSSYPDGEFPPGFAADLNAKYRERIVGQRLHVNELYLSLLYYPAEPPGSGKLPVWVTAPKSDESLADLVDALEACTKLRQEVLSALGRYEPTLLGTYEWKGRGYSTALEFLAFLVNGEWQRMPLPRAELAEVLATSRPFFGHELVELRAPTTGRLGAFLGIKDFPAETSPGMLNALLTAPFPFVLTQSFTPLKKGSSLGLLKRQLHRLGNAGDLAVSQAEDLRDALDAVASNAFVMGDYHFSLHVQTEPFEGPAPEASTSPIRALTDAVAEARTVLSDAGIVVAREDWAMEAAFWAQLPGNFSYRPRVAPISSRNFASISPFHNFPSGDKAGHLWGDATVCFMTTARTPYFFAPHVGDIGHTFLCGPTGSGKTVLLGFLVSMLQKHGPTQVLFDKDRGLEILVRALGGEYRALRNGEPTGFNPLALIPDAANREFLRAWLRMLVDRPNRPLTVRQEQDLDNALSGTLELSPSSRRLSRLVEFLDPTDPEGLHARLTRWCVDAGGEDGWIFDQGEDRVASLLSDHRLVGFDVTDFLEHPAARAPVSLYLFHLTSRLLDGRRMVVGMDEFAKLLDHEAFRSFAKNGLKTWRKIGGMGVFATQSPSDVSQSEIARTVIEQTLTKVFFPNAEASEEEYCGVFGCSTREFELVKHELEAGRREFLIKRPHVSVVGTLDLSGFDFEIDVISGRTRTVDFVNELISDLGPDPSKWLPAFKLFRSKSRT